MKKDLDVLALTKKNENDIATAAVAPSPPKRSIKAARLKKAEKELLQKDSKPLDATGFSHLEWSASVPYNLAEEPDEVEGMKHSHSCQSVTGLTLEELSFQKSCESSPVPEKFEKLQDINEEENNKNEEDDDEDENLTSPEGKVPISNETSSAFAFKSEEDGAAETNSIDQTIKDLEQDFETFAASNVKLTKIERRETQEELTKKLEKLRQESRSVLRDGILQQRPRAKSEEANKFPPDMRPRPRLSSEGREGTECDKNPEEFVVVEEEKLNAPGLVKIVSQTNGDSLNKKSSSKTAVLPPKQFRDVANSGSGGGRIPNLNQMLYQQESANVKLRCDVNKSSSSSRNSNERLERASQIQRSLEEKMEKRKSLLEETPAEHFSPNAAKKKSVLLEEEEEDGEIFLPLAKQGKEKEVKMLNFRQVMEGKKLSFDSDLFIVESTGDYLETKSLPRPKPRYSLF